MIWPFGGGDKTASGRTPRAIGQASVPAPDRSATLRRQMVNDQLLRRSISDERVLEAMAMVPRERFVPSAALADAYGDYPLPIGYGQTISQPYTVAFMCQALALTGTEKALEVGTGSGYGAAVLSRLARSVFSIERFPELAEPARARLAELGYGNVDVRVGDGSEGLPDAAPFDAIVVTAAAPMVPPAYIDQLAEGGRLVMPVGDRHEGQTLSRYTKTPGGIRSESLGFFIFVPLVGRFGVPEGGR